MNLQEQLLWVIYPYVALTIFIVGHLYRYHTDNLGWTARSSELLEKRSLRWGSLLFHFGILAVVGGHISGVLVPKELFEAIGIDSPKYHLAAVYGGGPAGILTLAGILILTVRRFANERVYAVSSKGDLVIVVLVLAEVVLGMASTFTTVFGSSHFEYRETIGPWFRGVLLLAPDASLMRQVPGIFKLHVAVGLAIFAVWPFTRLVHMWSVPVEYLNRAFIQYSRRNSF